MTTLHPSLKVERAHPAWLFVLLWYIATFIGGLTYAVPVTITHFVFGLERFFDPQHASEFTTPMLTIGAMFVGAACGSTIGLVQWLVLRRELKNIGGWIVATIAGYALIGVLLLIGNAFQPGWLNWAFTLIIDGKLHWLARVEPVWANSAWLPGAITLTLFGFALGVVQWFVLRGRVNRAGWWIAISTGGWALAAGLSSIAGAVAVYASWSVPTIFGGAGMVWLLRNRLTDEI